MIQYLFIQCLVSLCGREPRVVVEKEGSEPASSVREGAAIYRYQNDKTASLGTWLMILQCDTYWKRRYVHPLTKYPARLRRFLTAAYNKRIFHTLSVQDTYLCCSIMYRKKESSLIKEAALSLSEFVSLKNAIVLCDRWMLYQPRPIFLN
jgi:hypothetical protein